MHQQLHSLDCQNFGHHNSLSTHFQLPNDCKTFKHYTHIHCLINSFTKVEQFFLFLMLYFLTLFSTVSFYIFFPEDFHNTLQTFTLAQHSYTPIHFSDTIPSSQTFTSYNNCSFSCFFFLSFFRYLFEQLVLLLFLCSTLKSYAYLHS